MSPERQQEREAVGVSFVGGLGWFGERCGSGSFSRAPMAVPVGARCEAVGEKRRVALCRVGAGRGEQGRASGERASSRSSAMWHGRE